MKKTPPARGSELRMNKLLVESYRAALRAMEERYAIVEREVEELRRSIWEIKTRLDEAENPRKKRPPAVKPAAKFQGGSNRARGKNMARLLCRAF
jgi:hypothetical protein